jgi:hypothetical protein
MKPRFGGGFFPQHPDNEINMKKARRKFNHI